MYEIVFLKLLFLGKQFIVHTLNFKRYTALGFFHFIACITNLFNSYSSFTTFQTFYKKNESCVGPLIIP